MGELLQGLNAFAPSWLAALIGGMLIGTSATILLAFNGRIAGISGIINGAIAPTSRASSERWRWWFLGGLVVGAALYDYGGPLVGAPWEPTPRSPLLPVIMIVGGFLVGIGTRLGNGCTSGHGVCGLGRLSGRSLAAVLTFLSVAMLTVAVVRHGLGIAT
jgi:uncharacterized membrane protein YedE/YeeE